MANRNVSAFDASINCKATGTTTIVPAVAGKFFVVTSWSMEKTAMTAITVAPTVRLNGNGAAADLAASQSVPISGDDAPVGTLTFMTLGDGTGVRKRADLTNAIQVEVTVAATGTTMTCRAWVEGYYV